MGRKELDTAFTCCWTVLLPQAPQESPSPLLPRLLPASPSDLSTVQRLHSPCSRDGFPWLWQAPFRDWHQGDKRGHGEGKGRGPEESQQPGTEDFESCLLRGWLHFPSALLPKRQSSSEQQQRKYFSFVFTLPGEL